MKYSNNKLDRNVSSFNKLSIQLVILIIAIGIVGISSMDLSYYSVTAQTLQEKCNSDNGINISKSNCFSNAASSPVYNATNTNNVRPPS